MYADGINRKLFFRFCWYASLQKTNCMEVTCKKKAHSFSLLLSPKISIDVVWSGLVWCDWWCALTLS